MLEIFRGRCGDLDDGHRIRRPLSGRNPKTVTKFRELVVRDRRMTINFADNQLHNNGGEEKRSSMKMGERLKSPKGLFRTILRTNKRSSVTTCENFVQLCQTNPHFSAASPL